MRSSRLLTLSICAMSLPILVLASTRHHLRMHWWAYPPYTDLGNSTIHTDWTTKMTGIFRNILLEVLPLCNISSSDSQTEKKVESIYYPSPLDFNRKSQHIIDSAQNSSDMYFPVTLRTKIYLAPFVHPSHVDPAHVVFLPVLSSPGVVHFYKTANEPVASDLLNVILQGWPMLILILLGAGYSGIMIWILDRLWNETHFPKPFLRGFWEGFWWAFVTMTTVGYGDTTPRSVQARMFGLVWIVVGVTILSVFTATVTTVLTQESLGSHQRVQGQQLGVILGSQEYVLAFRRGGKPTEASSFKELIELLENRTVAAALYDQYSFISQQDQLDDSMVVESLLPNEVEHGILLHSADEQLRECLRHNMHHFRGMAFTEMANSIKALSVPMSSTVESVQSLFKPKTITYMWYGTLVWIVIFCGFIIWEFAYWRPKHKRRQAIKAAVLKSRLGHPNGDLSLSAQHTELEPNVVSMVLDSQVNVIGAEINKRNITDRQSSRKLQKDFISGKYPHARFYANHGFEGENQVGQANIEEGRTYRTDSLTEVTSLEALLKRQKEELYEMENEWVTYQAFWEQRVKDLKRQHREERRKMLRLMDHDEHFRNDIGGGASDVFYEAKLNNEESFDQELGASPLSVYDL